MLGASPADVLRKERGRVLIRRGRGGDLPETAATPKAVFRRQLIQGIAARPILLGGACRWSQAMETLGSAEKVPTQLFNGYAKFVANLYVGMKNRSLFM